MKTKITSKQKPSRFETFDVKFSEMTFGEAIALFNALGLWAERSAVANDVFCSLKAQMENTKKFDDNIKFGPPSFDQHAP